MKIKRPLIVTVALVGLAAPAAVTATPASAAVTGQMPSHHGHKAPVVRELATFAAAGCEGSCGSGSTVGPDGALYVTDGIGGRVVRIDPRTGRMTTFASGLPLQVAGLGGAIDVAFLGHTAYVLVTLVGPFFGQPDVVDGIYRVNKDGSLAVIADIGAWSTLNPPTTDYFVASGLQYAMQPYGDGFLVTDGHHNRVLKVKLDGKIEELMAFDDIVPTGLEVSGHRVYMGEAGPVPHRPETGRVVAFSSRSSNAREVASGASLIVDVEFGPRHQLYALSQGLWDLPNDPANAGAPASPNTGELVRVEPDGTFTTVVGDLDRPTSVEFIDEAAYVITLTGKVIKIDHISGSSR